MGTSIFISDIHLLAKKSIAKHVRDFLEELIERSKTEKIDNLYLVGDILDIWRIRQGMNMKKAKQDRHLRCIDLILRLALKSDIRVVWVLGNHDEYMTRFCRPLGTVEKGRWEFSFGDFVVTDMIEHRTSDGKVYGVLHGHTFDFITKFSSGEKIGKLGDVLYDIMISLNSGFNRFRRLVGMSSISFAKMAKIRVKRAANFLENFERVCYNECVSKSWDGIITGHVHDPKLEIENDIMYANCGCWTDDSNLTYIEEIDGEFTLRKWSPHNKRKNS